ncbi:hypothetical protein HPP92_015699 [Vanilla planifolia]|uniref:Reverse transcriptase domain-containing protein n=1 Tax=Vanilla planifolia TaxID=51239 RepID=A0A835UTX5_VANPL|nr:hypothetical protein HPP92_015699 [Vanilla planifolia]
MIPYTIGSTWIIPIPKSNSAMSFADYRPINLCNFSSKIFSKIIAIRLSLILQNIISIEQTAFVKGRNIAYNIILAQEMLNRINRRNRGNNTILKLDMKSAFDQVDWRYLEMVLKRFGFSDKFIRMVNNYLTSNMFSVLINGCPQGFFPASRGVRQGDSLSPALYVLASEVLIRSLKKLMEEKKIDTYSIPRGSPLISSLAFADDTLIFTSARSHSLKQLMNFLNIYQALSGQCINMGKSTFTCHNNISKNVGRRIMRITGFSKGKLPMKYLGVLIAKGRMKMKCSNHWLIRYSGELMVLLAKICLRVGS